ncbi:MAG: hypothetical protein LBL62_00040 [Planctomycetaceae bacterium]|nr:hypothetical protein [Planctomycetaceae bacterium]
MPTVLASITTQPARPFSEGIAHQFQLGTFLFHSKSAINRWATFRYLLKGCVGASRL